VIETDGSATSSTRHRAPDNKAPQDQRRGGQGGDVQFQGHPLPPGSRASGLAWVSSRPPARRAVTSTEEQLLRLELQPPPRLPCEIRLIRQDVDNGGIEALLEKRQQLGPDAVTRYVHVSVRFVFDVPNPKSRKIGSQLVAAARQQRANEPAVARMHRGQTPRTGAAEQSQQERLGLVVTRMTKGEDISLETSPGAFKKRVTRRVGGVLERAPLAPSARGDVLAFHAQRPPERSGELGTESLVSIRRVTKLMVEMGQTDDAHLTSRVETPHHVSERDGVGSTRQPDGDARGAVREIVATDELADPVEKRAHGVLVPEGGFEPPTPRL
jgi:hypothetical protein